LASGALYPSSLVFVTSGLVGPAVHVGAATTGLRRTRGIRVVAAADLSANADVEMTFDMPPALPSGTGKLILIGRTQGTGDAKIDVSWASVAIGEDPSAATLLSEGTTTITVAGGDSDKFLRAKVTLDADTLVADEIVAMRLRFLTSGWTLNQPLTVLAYMRWE
jgi:hypothetical protein